MSLVIDSDGNERLKKNTVDERAIKSKDVQKSKDITSLLRLGRPKTAIIKSGSDDEGLGQALDDMLNGTEVNPNSKGSVSPLQSLSGDENDSNNEVDYSDEDHDYLTVFEEREQAHIDQEAGIQNNKSQDAQQTN
jgi:hypothetical protein